MKRVHLLLVFILLCPAILAAQVKINEVLYNTATDTDDRIELKNFGSTSVDVTNWWFCAQFVYERIGTLTVVSGSLNIPPGGLLVLSGKALSNSSDLGLYNDINNNTANFAVASFMEDFVQWGSGGHGRESVAVSKGIWTSGAFVPGVATGHSIEYDGDGNSPDDWADQPTPTLGQENSNVTSVDDGDHTIPTEFALTQNYPNPFNPSTVIRYTIPQSTRVRLEIFNILGQKVRTLIDGQQAAGSYSAPWDGRDDAGKLLTSGVYLYRLQAGQFVESKKMIFVQ